MFHKNDALTIHASWFNLRCTPTVCSGKIKISKRCSNPPLSLSSTLLPVTPAVINSPEITHKPSYSLLFSNYLRFSRLISTDYVLVIQGWGQRSYYSRLFIIGSCLRKCSIIMITPPPIHRLPPQVWQIILLSLSLSYHHFSTRVFFYYSSKYISKYPFTITLCRTNHSKIF